MTFSNIVLKNNSLSFDIENIDKSLVNAIRRIAISEIPTIAFKTEPITESNINILENRSGLHNEFLSHRIGMTPLHIPEDEIQNHDSNNYIYVLNIINDTDEILEVTSRDFEIKITEDVFLERSKVKKIFPPDRITGDYMIITRLKPDITGNKNGERIHIEGRATKDIGLKNARWSPVETCTYNFKRDQRDGLEHYKIEIAKINDGRRTNNMPLLTKNEEADLLHQYDIHTFDRYYLKDNFGEPNSFEFRLITINLPPVYVITKSMKILIDKIQNVKYELENIEESTLVSIMDCENRNIPNCVDITIKDESHTLGNLFQSYINIYSHNFNSSIISVDMVGYKCPHPLEKKLVLRIKPKIDTEDRDIDYSYISKNILIKTCDNLIYLINELIVEWNTITQQTSDIVEKEITDIKPEVIQKTDIFKEYNQDYEKKSKAPKQETEPEQEPEPKAVLKKKRIVKKK
jgi:DNA-directed RNA polymerase subunit L